MASFYYYLCYFSLFRSQQSNFLFPYCFLLDSASLSRSLFHHEINISHLFHYFCNFIIHSNYVLTVTKNVNQKNSLLKKKLLLSFISFSSLKGWFPIPIAKSLSIVPVLPTSPVHCLSLRWTPEALHVSPSVSFLLLFLPVKM